MSFTGIAEGGGKTDGSGRDEDGTGGDDGATGLMAGPPGGFGAIGFGTISTISLTIFSS